MPAEHDSPVELNETSVPRLLWTVDEVARAIGVTPDCVRNLHRVGLLAGVRVGRYLRWRPADVEAYVKRLVPGSDE